MGRRRERSDIGRDVRYIRRDAQGRFTSDQVDAGRSAAADQRRQAKDVAAPGQGDRGDRRSDPPARRRP